MQRGIRLSLCPPSSCAHSRGKVKRPGETVFSGPHYLRKLLSLLYGFSGVDCPVFGSAGVVALAAMGFAASTP